MRFSLSLPRSVKMIVEPNQDTEHILSLVINGGGRTRDLKDKQKQKLKWIQNLPMHQPTLDYHLPGLIQSFY